MPEFENIFLEDFRKNNLPMAAAILNQNAINIILRLRMKLQIILNTLFIKTNFSMTFTAVNFDF